MDLYANLRKKRRSVGYKVQGSGRRVDSGHAGLVFWNYASPVIIMDFNKECRKSTAAFQVFFVSAGIFRVPLPVRGQLTIFLQDSVAENPPKVLKV